jgi:membrane protein
MRLKSEVRGMAKLIQTLKKSVSEFSNDECMSSGAAMAYYAIFSLPPLLILVGAIAGYFGIERQRIQELVQKQLGITTLSEQNFEQQQAGGSGGQQQPNQGQQPAGGLGMAWQIAGAAILIFSATGLFAQLQYALNRAWGVMPDPEQGGVVSFLFKRVLSFGMILVVLLLLLMSLVLTTVIDEITAYVQGGTPSGVSLAVGIVLNNLATFAIATLLFAAMFKVLPDAKMAWRDMWVGAMLTALLFVIGKALIGWYVQSSDLGSTWGSAAASLIGVLVWMYYSSLIVLFGAELTQVWASEHGRGIRPDDGAIERTAVS